MKLFLLIINLTVLACICYRLWMHERSSLRKFFWPALLFRLATGLLLGLVYLHYYTVGDTFLYFKDGVTLAQVARNDFNSYVSFLWMGDESFSFWTDLSFQQPRALFLSKVVSVLCLLCYDNYWIISLWFSLLTFVSAWLLVKKIKELYPATEIAAVIGFLFFPSAVFWGSGLIKESMALAGLFFLSIIVLTMWNKKRVSAMEWILVAVAIWVVWNLKYYFLAVFLPVTATAFITKALVSRMKLKTFVGEVALWCGIFFIPILLMSVLHPNFYLHRLMDVVVLSYQEFYDISNTEDLIHYRDLQPTVLSIARNSPRALVSGFFRPFITEAHGLLQWFGAIENLILLGLFLFALPGIKKIRTSENRLLLFSTIVYVFILCIFLSLSTPNFGTLSRYRVGFLPFLVYVLTINNALINKLMTTKIGTRLVR